MCVHVHHVCAILTEAREGIISPLRATTHVLGIQVGSSTKAASALNH